MIFSNKALGLFVTAAMAASSPFVAADGDVALRGHGDRKLQCEKKTYMGLLKPEMSCEDFDAGACAGAANGCDIEFCSEYEPEDFPDAEDDAEIMDVVQFDMCETDVTEAVKAYFLIDDDPEDGDGLPILDDITDIVVDPTDDVEGAEMETETDSVEGEDVEEADPAFEDPCYINEGGPAVPEDFDEMCPGGVERHRQLLKYPLKFNPHDPSKAKFFEKQWNMDAIDAEGAWDCGRKGEKWTRVGVLDTGIDYTHPELWWRVDKWRSFDKTGETKSGYWSSLDLHGHGTAVASVIATNAFGIAGVTSKTTLVAGKVCNKHGYCNMKDVLSGLVTMGGANKKPKKWRKKKGGLVDIINISIPFRKKIYSKRMYKMIWHIFKRIANNGITVVSAAGDEGINLDHDYYYKFDFCDIEKVICVSSTGPLSSDSFKWGPWYHVDYPAFHIKKYRKSRHLIAGSANYGKQIVDIAAPGGNWGGSILSACSKHGKHAWCHRSKPWYTYRRGTGMAAAHVSGAAAMVINNPHHKRNPRKIRWTILEKADDLGRTSWDPFYGMNGRLNVQAAVCPPMCCSKHHNGGEEGAFYAIGAGDDEDCTRFVHCVDMNGMVMQTGVQSCPAGLQYNFELEQCVWPAQTVCPERLTGDPENKEGPFPVCTPGMGTD